MNSKFAVAVFVTPILVACGQAKEQDNSVLNAALKRAPSQIAVVRNCKGVLNEKWLSLDKHLPVVGELDISVLTKAGTKQITGVSLRVMIPAHRVAGVDAIVNSQLVEVKSAVVESLKVYKVRGSAVTFMNAAPNQQGRKTVGGQIQPINLANLEFRNGDGADYVPMQLTLLDPVTAKAQSVRYTFEGCGLENIPLLLANSKPM